MSPKAAHVTVTKKPEDSTVEITAEIPIEGVTQYRAKAVKEIAQEVSIDGFRKGGAPESVLISRVGEAAILERTASIAIADELPLILAKEKIGAIERPNVTVTKLASGNPIAFKATVTVLPDVTLPDYRTIGKKHAKTATSESVSDDELTDMTRFLRRERARIERVEAGLEPQAAHEEAQKLEEKDLPPLDEEFAKALGAESVESLTTRMRENMLADKKKRAQEKVRIALIEEIIDKSKLSLPAILIEHELDTMMNRLAHDIQHAGSTLDAYMKNAGKTAGDFRKEWRASAEKRAKMHIVVNEIALKESLKPAAEDVTHEIANIKHHQKESHGQDVDEIDLRMRVEQALLPETVFRFLESQ